MKFLLSALIFVLCSATLAAPARLQLITDLGPDGNSQVKERYTKYLGSGLRCFLEKTEGTKVLITGFGLFSGATSNISSSLVKSAFDTAKFPGTIDRAHWLDTNKNLEPGIVNSDVGVESSVRKVTIDGKVFTLCLLAVDVQWDFAAAVIVTEMQAFMPDHVFMFGQGSWSVDIEGGAYNSAARLNGFTRQGGELLSNTPVNKTMFDRLPSVLPLSIDQEKVGRYISDSVTRLYYDLNIFKSARVDNDYICNNVAYTVQAAANGETLNLAGGDVPLTPRFAKAPVVGFIHLPIQSSRRLPADSWMRFLADLIYSTSEK